jgi:hypothetical protein
MTGKRILAALIAAGLLLVVADLAIGAFGKGTPKIADPCKPRAPFAGGGIDGTVQRVVLNGLDGAACQLHTSREELVLSLDPNSTYGRRRNPKTVENALRAGLVRAIDDADRRGDIPGFLAPVLRQLVESAPIDKLVKGGFNLSDLIG